MTFLALEGPFTAAELEDATRHYERDPAKPTKPKTKRFSFPYPPEWNRVARPATLILSDRSRRNP